MVHAKLASGRRPIVRMVHAKLASGRRIEKSESESIFVFFSLYIEASWYVLFIEFGIEFSLA